MEGAMRELAALPEVAESALPVLEAWPEALEATAVTEPEPG